MEALRSPPRRIIPTLVGNGNGGTARRFAGSGSSPRSWGTDGSASSQEAEARIIPTLVGNGVAEVPGHVRPPDHPHARGERGVAEHPHGLDERIIPTLVGNGADRHRGGRLTPDHPHARGERVTDGTGRFPMYGSSPRSWGTVDPGAEAERAARIIPTLVGNGAPAGMRAEGCADHPHARGERGVVCAAGEEEDGSSPRSWGTVHRARDRDRRRRIIPTLVGNGLGVSRQTVIPSDHPHARGERDVDDTGDPLEVGSSPRSWGTAIRPGPGRLHERIIPTLVGNGPLRHR